MARSLSGRCERQFVALQEFLVPRSKGFSADQKTNSLRLVTDFLEKKSARDRFRLKLFLELVDFASLCLALAPFRRLSAKNKKKVVELFFNARVEIFRKGFWGVNTLAKLGVFSQESIYEEIHYIRKATPE